MLFTARRYVDTVSLVVVQSCLHWLRSSCTSQMFPNQGSAEYRHGFREKSWKNKYKFLNTAKNSKYPSKYRGNFCPVIGNTGVISVRYQLPLCFVLVIRI
jgi:hypothetical protein